MEERKNAVQENQKIKKIIEWPRDTKEMDSKAIQRGFFRKLRYNIAKDRYTFTDYDLFLSLSYTIRDRIIERWIATQQQYHDNDVKRSYYLSLEFLLGRLLDNNIINLGIKNIITEAMKEMGICFEDLEDQEVDAGLGNGGLGRLAACFLDSMATLELPATGYGIRYDFGIFTQKIIDGYQKELPEHWLENVNPWEIERPEYKCRVQFYGNVLYKKDDNGNETAEWLNTETVVAMPYDTPIPGYKNNTVNSLRLWSARSANQIHFEHFQAGDYIAACQDKLTSENISKVLYPNDSNHSGKELRLKQQFFFSSASLQDIIRRYQKHHKDFSEFSTKTAIQLNDTHPAIAIVELMRLLVDEHHVPWNDAWEIVEHTFAYTNHTLMPEALEKWPVSLMRSLLPRHMDIIFKINARFMRQVSYKFPGDNERRKRMSLIEEGGEQLVRMAYLAIVGSHSVNGVARLHTNLLKQGLVRDFYEMWPEKFNNKTNGITQRRWLAKANPPLATLITNTIGDAWIKDLTALKGLKKYAADSAFQKEWCAVKHQCKERLAVKIKKWYGFDIALDTIFDVQIKRIHEYKRQLLNIFHCIHLYNGIKDGTTDTMVPRTVFFGGKAAPGYYMAKLIIKFINNVATLINNDPYTKDLLKIYFIPNYRVSLAEYLIPAADVSQQISTAGTEASGTGNMKFGLNGALTIGTMDGATVEMAEEIGEENMFIFGLRSTQVDDLKKNGYNPHDYYLKSEALRRVIDLVAGDFFCEDTPGMFKPLIDSLFNNDRYFLFADFDAYLEAHERLSKTYRDANKWTEMSILNVANIGNFSSDRTIGEYAKEIWDVKPMKVEF